ncbi:TIGR02677 family protein [Anaerobranca californiensis DSM 14826]|uniref:TIGR02677 family protein n=1 Tax=Anaerobranca californiensis DSM 14826 TaxID=1120989 RepID=A0A1M6PBR5_9FIRM|nr:TIGR02677 family protein [Anaerobranca californiensis]SHK05409.1 TIGR02677 family protein [Anaerobranca californiensis DSM 14826]
MGFKISDDLFNQINEVKYLTVENTWRYRPIIRIMHDLHLRYKYWIHKEEIYHELKKYPQFKDYTLDNLKNDLDYLVENKNLVALQDTKKVKTLEEFKNRQFQYQLSLYTIEIERMVMGLENIKGENKGTLDSELVYSFRKKLEGFLDIKGAPPKKVYSWWSEVSDDFKKINENYQDYIKSFYSPKVEELMQTTAFLMYKENFIKYLREFIKGLQENIYYIQKVFSNIDDQEIEVAFTKVLEYEKTIPRINYNLDESSFLKTNIERWYSIKNWFISHKEEKSDCELILDITNEIIMKITRYASQISERRNSGANRRMEYRKLLEIFHNCQSLEDAHKLSAVTIGLFNSRHIAGNTLRETESINSSIFEEKPHEVVIKPRTRNYRERVTKNPIEDKREQKELLKRELQQKREMERQVVEELIVENKIVFKDLPQLDQFQRNTLLRWLSRATNNKSKKSKTEYGREYKVVLIDDQKISVSCQDGRLIMPNYELHFF